MNIRRPMCIMAVVFLSFISILIKAFDFIPQYPELYGKSQTFVGKCHDKSVTDDKVVIYLKSATNKPGLLLYFPIDANCDAMSIQIGDKLCGRGDFYSFDTAENYGQFDSKRYYCIRGYNYRVMNCEITKVYKSSFPFREILFRLKYKIKNIYTSTLDVTDAGIISAIMLADKTELDKEVKELYQLGGIAHILSLSGLHIATLGLALLNALIKLFRVGFSSTRLCDDLNTGGKKTTVIAGIISGLVMLLYSIMTGLNVSTVRALVMFVLGLLSRVSGRTYDLLSAAAFSSVVVVIMNPLYLYDAGFQLSFMAVISIGLICPYLIILFPQLSNNKIMQGIFVSIAVQIGTLPIMAYHYYQFSILGIILNIVVVPLMSVLLIMGVVLAINPIDFIAVLCGKITHVILTVYEYLSSICASIRWNVIITGKPTVLQILLYYCVIIGIGFGIRIIVTKERTENRTKKYKLTIDQNSRRFIGHKTKFDRILKRLILCGFLMLACVILMLGHEHPYSIYNLSVGQGDCSVIMNKTHVIIVDCGSTSENMVGVYRLIPFLKANRVNEVDAIFISHFDDDHVNGILELINDRVYQKRINKIIISRSAVIYDGMTENYIKLTNESITHDIPICVMSKGDYLCIGDSLIECLSPTEGIEYKDTNSASMILSFLDRVSHKRAIFTGDSDFDSERILLENVLGSDRKGFDYLKVSHHGSDSSSSEAFLDFVTDGNYPSERICVISVGRNNRYGHPGKEALERLERYYKKDRILRTDISGETAVRFR